VRQEQHVLVVGIVVHQSGFGPVCGAQDRQRRGAARVERHVLCVHQIGFAGIVGGPPGRDVGVVQQHPVGRRVVRGFQQRPVDGVAVGVRFDAVAFRDRAVDRHPAVAGADQRVRHVRPRQLVQGEDDFVRRGVDRGDDVGQGVGAAVGFVRIRREAHPAVAGGAGQAEARAVVRVRLVRVGVEPPGEHLAQLVRIGRRQIPVPEFRQDVPLVGTGAAREVPRPRQHPRLRGGPVPEHADLVVHDAPVDRRARQLELVAGPRRQARQRNSRPVVGDDVHSVVRDEPQLRPARQRVAHRRQDRSRRAHAGRIAGKGVGRQTAPVVARQRVDARQERVADHVFVRSDARGRGRLVRTVEPQRPIGPGKRIPPHRGRPCRRAERKTQQNPPPRTRRSRVRNA